MYAPRRKSEKKSPITAYEKTHSDDEQSSEKIALRSKVLLPKPDSSNNKKPSGRPFTAPKPPQNIISIKPVKNSDSSSMLNKKNRQITTDKEKLYEENLELKQKNNSLNDENLKLKTKLFQLEKELTKKDDSSEPGKNSSHLLANLKQIVKDLKQQLSEKTSEVETCRKNAKTSKVQELETEVKVFSDECTRLKHHLAEVLKAQGSSFEVSGQALEKNIQSSIANEAIRRENMELAGKIEELKQEKEGLISKLQEKRKVKKRNEINPKVEVVKLKAIIDKISKEKDELDSEKSLEISDMKKVMIEYQTELKSAGKTIQQMKTTIESLENELNQLKKTSKNTETGFQFTHKVIKKRQNPPKLLKMLNAVVNSKKMILGVLLTLIDKNNLGRLEVDEFVKKMRTYYPAVRRKHVESVVGMMESLNGNGCGKKEVVDLNDLEEFYELFDYDAGDISSDSSEEKENLEKKEAKAKTDAGAKPGKPDAALDTQPSSKTMESEHLVFTQLSDSPHGTNLTLDSSHSLSKQFPLLQQAIQHIYFRLQLNRIPEKSLFNIIFPGADHNFLLSPNDVKFIFQHPPFSLTEAEHLEDLVHSFQPSLTPGQFVVNLVDLLPDWEILSEVEERVLDQELNQVISSNFEVLCKACSLVDRKRQSCLTVDEFFSVFRTLSIDLDDKMKGYVRLLLYSYDMRLDVAPYNHFLQIYRKMQLSNEERAVIVRSYLTRIADVLRKNRISAIDVFSTNDENVITEDFFYEGLERLGMFNLPKDHIDVIIEALQCDAGEIGISLFELNDILGHYGVVQNQTITEESRSLYSSFESEKKELSQIDESADHDYSNEYEEEDEEEEEEDYE